MIVTLESLSSETVHDVCIAGSGPAGMTLALALAERGKNVLLLEGGGRELSDRSQDLYIGEITGDPYYDLDVARLRFLGGTSNHWAGRCRPLDAIDFAYKDYSPQAHWPIDRQDLDPYLERAKDILDLDGDFEDETLDPALRRLAFRFSTPVTRFGEKYGTSLRENPRIVVALETSVVGLEIEDSRVGRIRVRDFEGHTKALRADTFVLACGGIENSRLLLHFNAETEGRLVPQARTLGRYWMEHPHFTVGEVVFASEHAGDAFFGLTPERMRELEVLNCALFFRPLRSQAGMSRLAHDLACTAPRLGERVYRRLGRRLVCASPLYASWEEEPKFDSHIALSENQRDAFGIPRAALHWRKSARDIETARATALEFGSLLARQDIGRARLAQWIFDDGPWPEDDQLGG